MIQNELQIMKYSNLLIDTLSKFCLLYIIFEFMIHKNLKKLREFRNYSQEFMAGELGKSQNAYSQMETGKTKIKEEEIIKLAAILEVTPTELMSDEPIVIKINNTKVENGGIFNGNLQNLYYEQKEEIAFLREQLAKKDEQIDKILSALK
jgi:transcriptional regulator with XRE-family HTH domain